jgi:hypothetical protein
MNMEICSQCFGAGHAQCFNCHHGWRTSHSGPTGGIEMCGMCGGSGKIRCSTCGGTGMMDRTIAKPQQIDPKKMRTVLVLLAVLFVVFFVLPKLFLFFFLAKYACLLTLSCQ